MASDINGDGYGSKHQWKHSHTSAGRQTLYTCRDCGVNFWHDYSAIPDIFTAMKLSGVPEDCEVEVHVMPATGTES